MKDLRRVVHRLRAAAAKLQARAYSLTLSPHEYQALEIMSVRGYDGGLLKHADDVDEGQGRVVLRFSESSAWQVNDAYNDDPEAYGAMASSSLRQKMFDFVDSIV